MMGAFGSMSCTTRRAPGEHAARVAADFHVDRRVKFTRLRREQEYLARSLLFEIFIAGVIDDADDL
jgi:hypothetical protein